MSVVYVCVLYCVKLSWISDVISFVLLFMWMDLDCCDVF